MQNVPINDGKDLDQWYWCGFAGHFVGGHNCSFHLATIVPTGYLISTVGSYMPNSFVNEPLGANPDHLFETMIFECDGLNEYGNPNIRDLIPIEEFRYAKSVDAEQGHHALCEYWSRRKSRFKNE